MIPHKVQVHEAPNVYEIFRFNIHKGPLNMHGQVIDH